MEDQLQQYANAIASIESGGNYGELGPVTKNGDRAYGRYQVMGSNVPEWTQAALGTAMSPQEFLNNPDAQDAVFRHRFGSYVDRFGNPQDAAASWFSGRPLSKSGSDSDGYINTNDYVRRFNKALVNNTGGALAYANANTPDGSPALAAINGATQTPQRTQMAQNDNGILSQGVLKGLGGLGPALQDAGAFALSANNPAALAGTNHVEKYLAHNNPQIIDGGTDIYGKKILYTFSPTTGLRRVNVGAALGSNGSQGGAGGSVGGDDSTSDLTADKLNSLINAHRAGTLSNEDLLAQTGLVGKYAQSLADGTGDPRMLGMKAGALRPTAIILAKELNPNMPFDENAIHARQEYNKLLATGSSDPSKLPGAIASASKMVEHALQVAQTSKQLSDLQGSNVDAANTAENWWKAKFSKDNNYKSALNALNQIADTYSGEQDRLATGGHPTLAGHDAVTKRLAADMTHEERMGGLAQSVTAALAPLDQMTTNHNVIFGTSKKPEDFFDQKTRDNLAKLQKLIGESHSPSTTTTSTSGANGLPPGVRSIKVIGQ